MANVTLPNIDSAETNIQVLVPQMLNAYAKLTKELSWLLNNLDTRNVNELNAEVIVAGSITAGKLAANSVVAENITAGSVETDKLAAGAVTAEKITVGQLSAIAADLGHITAGLIESIEIYGSYIATRNGSFPRAEMSNTEHLFAAFTDADNHVKVRPDLSGAPGVRFTAGGNVLGALTTYLGFLEVWVPSILKLTAPTVRVNGWGSLYSISEGRTLSEELDNIYTLLDSKADVSHTHSVTIPNHNHGNPDNLNSGGGTFVVS
ncbi:hypothetical protein [Paenibacillus sonchi]|uniref:hypothetical protein n=1 Tax=Paenibacillus sonchi TaxID=373687 RepID=UPI001E32EE68|nr:hypothetical protein [Paenibacillus sonchi]MCE3202469.1 hypothetical protein [Paenibacillus sonchi]